MLASIEHPVPAVSFAVTISSPQGGRLRRRLEVASEAFRCLLQFVADTPSATTFVAGGVGGAVSRTFTAPLDRIKVLAQEGRVVQWAAAHPTVHQPIRAPGDIERMAQLARYVFQYQGGVKGFWRGNGVNCMKAGPEFATAFMTRQFYVQRICRDPANPTFGENFLVGALGGTTAQSLLYPLEVVKTRMAVSGNGEYSNIADCFVQSLRRGGIADLYRGIGANAAGLFPHRGLEMGIFFTLQQQIARRYSDSTVPLAATTCISFVASTVAQVLTYPLNLVRTRLQTQGVNGRPLRYKGMVHCVQSILADEGVRGLFVGLAPNMLKAVPASMIMYIAFNQTRAQLETIRQGGNS